MRMASLGVSMRPCCGRPSQITFSPRKSRSAKGPRRSSYGRRPTSAPPWYMITRPRCIGKVAATTRDKSQVAVRHCEREPKQSRGRRHAAPGLLRRFAPRNDGGGLDSRPDSVVLLRRLGSETALRMRHYGRKGDGAVVACFHGRPRSTRQREIICLRMTFGRLGGARGISGPMRRGGESSISWRLCLSEIQKSCYAATHVDPNISLTCFLAPSWLVSARSLPAGGAAANIWRI
jgi:hypothetical protein